MTLLNTLKNFLGSEKAIATGVLVIAATVMVILGKMTIQEWTSYTEILAGIYVGGKAIQGAASQVSGARGAKAELASIKAALASNDSAADAAVAEKFGGEFGGETR